MITDFKKKFIPQYYDRSFGQVWYIQCRIVWFYIDISRGIETVQGYNSIEVAENTAEGPEELKRLTNSLDYSENHQLALMWRLRIW